MVYMYMGLSTSKYGIACQLETKLKAMVNQETI